MAARADGIDVMTKEKAFLQEELERVKFRIKILNMIEDKLKEMKSLAEQVTGSELGQEESAVIQSRVNKLVREIDALDKLKEPVRVLN